ncbi:SDR family oxidoreductase [Siculibacillus lacustris]|uniref:SDR family oxidoreductase n=1 Tax=Siculibacillus lacustris TaxID=1549641 RepID=A0A4Q9VQ92_9HYPH|nr:SDR family oxidoreductase [Siculibacillus lacustris]
MKNRNAIVTGATSGIGLGIAQALAAQGCNLMIGGFAPAGVPERLCREIAEEFGVKVIYSGADLSKPAETRGLAAQALEAFGNIDILVNDAGLQYVAPIVDFPDEKWELLQAVLLDAPFHLTKAVLPGMLERKWGRIVNVSSVMGMIAAPHKPAYVAAKHGLAGLTKSVALEVAEHGITCNAIMPATVLTNVILSQLPNQAKVLGCTEEEAMDRVFTQNMPTHRLIDPWEIGATAVFLCSEGAKSITGVLLPVDGGYTAR